MNKYKCYNSVVKCPNYDKQNKKCLKVNREVKKMFRCPLEHGFD